ncbi:FtsX-like permease family protein [Humibacillus xanthopallidus]|uniref:FtsX-like permease family protein n=1 Tax=Humibacillus xanthopallidus TaxID=412689 RepID=A0A543I2F4_9MICO|nr:FtsX-like permease family protein [Humibacillus xanthopallidus]TQM64721.1 FtsX-like permease family protein [Humibacillus xanthopallidus]
MAEHTLGNAWANVTGRRVASVTTVLVVASLMAAVTALLVPLRDVRDNQRAAYDRPEWQSVFLVEGIAGADQPMTPSDVKVLRETPGVTGVWPIGTTEADAAGSFVQLRSWVAALDVPIVVGRPPAAGACEAAVTRSVPGATVGAPLEVALPGGGSSVAGQVRPIVVGVVDQGYPLVSGPSALTTCPMPSTQAPEQLVVATDTGQLPDRYVGESLDAAAARSMDGSTSTGVMGLLALVLAVLSLVVVGSVARWSVRSRLGEFTTLRVWGRSRSDIIGMVGVEQALLALLAAPLGVALGTVLAWVLVRSGGESSMVDPAAGIAVALPSASTIGLAVGGFGIGLVVLTVAPVARALAPDVARLLRRRGE